MDSKEDINKFFRNVDQMVTMHSVLHDGFKRLSLWFDIGLLSSSTILCVSVFMDHSVLQRLGLEPSFAKDVLGICSIITFLISLVVWKSGWKQTAGRHGHSRDVLARIKFEIRDVKEASEDEKSKFIKKASIIINGLEKIPENRFLKLKAIHRRKVEFSKYIGNNPMRYYFINWILFNLESLKSDKS